MDSLLASYASSDEEGEEQKHHQEEMSFKTISRSGETFSTVTEGPQTSRIFSSLPQPKSSSSDSLSLPQPKNSSTALSPLSQPKSSVTSSSLPQPKSSSAFPSLPQPKFSSDSSSLSQPISSSVFSSLPPPNSFSKFSSIPPPTSNNPQTPLNSMSSISKPKRVVQFRPPIMLKPPTDEDDDEEEEERQKKPMKEATSSSSNSSLSSFFSSLPPPKNTLGSGSAPVLGAGRRSVIETNMSNVNYDGDKLESKVVHFDDSRESHVVKCENESSSVSTAEPVSTGSGPSNCNPSDEHYGSYGYYEDSRNYGGYDVNYGNYDGVSTIPSTTYMPETSGLYENIPKPGKRGRKEIPADIVEVNQDELMKNRPREDQVKSTGIAFGPSYQPTSTKGKPSKLHKRKHQIGALYFDMRQKEHELAERRSKGFLTKAETQAKYGW